MASKDNSLKIVELLSVYGANINGHDKVRILTLTRGIGIASLILLTFRYITRRHSFRRVCGGTLSWCYSCLNVELPSTLQKRSVMHKGCILVNHGHEEEYRNSNITV